MRPVYISMPAVEPEPAAAGDKTATDPGRATDNHGEVFTRRWVVELVLDLAGYTADRDLGGMVAIEPACGKGAFLGPMVERLVASCARHCREVADVTGAIRASDLLASNVHLARQAVAARLGAAGLDSGSASGLSRRWIVQRDFLLGEHDFETADFVVGNPPYIRLENVPSARSNAYRNACPTMRGRSDIFVGFIELGLRLLRPGGVLGFIVADRWMRNRYGGSLRSMIVDGYSVEAVVQMHDVDAFEVPVSAYPAVTVLRRAAQGAAMIANTTASFGQPQADDLSVWATAKTKPRFDTCGVQAAMLPGWFGREQSWPTGSPEELSVVADLERRFALLEDASTGTRVGIGVASGADSVYLTRDTTVVEPDRLLPLVMAGDTAGGRIRWSGTHLVNPWRDGTLVPPDEFPRLRSYLESRSGVVRARHVAKRNPDRWYRTIDRVEPGLLSRPKLLLPDLKAAIHPVLDEGRYYPHHNLYFVVSDRWDLDVLGGLLLSDVANLFVGTYCVRMRGGCLRFQAQYLRRIRVPAIDSLERADRRALARAFAGRDVEAATAVALRVYGLKSLPQSAAAASRRSAKIVGDGW